MNGCLAGDDLPGDETLDSPDLGTLTENLALPAPVLLTVTAINPTTETITWSAINDPTLKYYIADRGLTPATVGTLTSVAPTKTTWTSSNLTPNTQYCWGVRDVNTSNQVSPRSNIICVTTPATSTTPAPTGLVADAISDSRITLTWNAVPNTSVYHVFFRVQGAGAFTGLATVSAPTTTFIAANLTAATTYEFVVTAVTAAGESPQSNIASATTFQAGLEGYWRFDEGAGGSAADRSGFARTVTLSGATFVNDIAPVRGLRDSIDPDRNTAALSIGAASGSQATSTTAGAFRFAGASFSFAGWVKLPVATATDIVGERAAGCGTLGWKLGQDAVNGLAIAGAGGTFGFGTSLAANTWTHVAFTYDSTTTTLVAYVNGSQTAAGAYTAKNGLTTVPLTFGHVGGCAGGAASLDEVRIYSRALSAAEVAAFGRQPVAPTLTVTAPFANEELLSWTAVPGATKFAVYKGTAAGNETFFTQVVGGGAATGFVGQHLDPLTQYSWYVRVETGELDSNPSNEVVLTTPDVPPAPVVTVGTVTATRVNLSWTAIPGAVLYRVWQSTNGGPFVGIQALPGTSTSVANLTSGTTYQFEVQAEDANANRGHLSAPVTATTP